MSAQPPDAARCKDQLWLLKVPRNVMEYWNKECTGSMPLGELRATGSSAEASSFMLKITNDPARAFTQALSDKEAAFKAAEAAHAEASAQSAAQPASAAHAERAAKAEEVLRAAEHAFEVAERNASQLADLVSLEYPVRVGAPPQPMYAYSQRQTAKEAQEGAPARVRLEGMVCAKGTVELSELGSRGGGAAETTAGSYRRLVKQRTQIAKDELFKPPQEAHTEEEKRIERMLVAGRIDDTSDRSAKRKYAQGQREKKAGAVDKQELTAEQIHQLVFAQFKVQAFWSKRELARAVGATKKSETDRVAKFLDEIGERQRVGPHKNEYALKSVYRQP